MSHRKALEAALALFVPTSAIVAALPTLQFPINSQVPPVARIEKPFSFAFSASTFGNDAGFELLSYSLQDQPSWLELDSATRQLSGTPSNQDVGAAHFRIVAEDQTGSAMGVVTLVVENTTSLGVGDPLINQLQSSSNPTSSSSWQMLPLQTFLFSFSHDTFTGTTASTNYYAVSADNSPLPSWIQFDPSKLSISGMSPPLVSPDAAPQTYGIKLIASDVPGFAEVTTGFQIVVGYHIFSFSVPQIDVNGTTGHPLQIPSLLSELKLDGEAAAPRQLASITSDAPSWLQLNPNDLSLSGTPPNKANSSNITITVIDQFDDLARIIINIQLSVSETSLFTGRIPDVNATIGKPFHYVIDSAVLNEKDLRITADLGSTSSWLEFNPNTLSFDGQVPVDQKLTAAVISITAQTDLIREETSFSLFFVKGRANPTENVSNTWIGSGATTTPTSSATILLPPTNQQKDSSANRTEIIIVLSTILPIIVIALLACVLAVCHKRRRRRQAEKQAFGSTANDSGSIMFAEHLPHVTDVPILGDLSSNSARQQSSSAGPPQIYVLWPPDSLQISRHRISKPLRAKKSSSLDTSWRQGVQAATDAPLITAQNRPGATKVPDIVSPNSSLLHGTIIAEDAAPNSSRVGLLFHASQPKHAKQPIKQPSRALSTISMTNTGLPQRLSGAGHGRGGLGTTGPCDARSWQTTSESMPAARGRNGMAVLDNVLSPPHEIESALQISTPSQHETVLRGSSSDATSWRDQRPNGHVKRAHDKLESAEPFSSAWSSRSRPGSAVLVDATESNGRPLSAPRQPEASSRKRLTHQSWSQWSRVGPAGHGISVRSPEMAVVRAPSRLRSDVSVASSGKFGSALSSGSQWEDEHLIEDEDQAWERTWQTIERSEGAERSSARFQFEQMAGSQDSLPNGALLPPRTLRLLDRQPSVDRGKNALERSERSHRGSLAFI